MVYALPLPSMRSKAEKIFATSLPMRFDQKTTLHLEVILTVNATRTKTHT
jgi:hypothetical protein